jgi:hypothetical protein
LKTGLRRHPSRLQRRWKTSPMKSAFVDFIAISYRCIILVEVKRRTPPLKPAPLRGYRPFQHQPVWVFPLGFLPLPRETLLFQWRGRRDAGVRRVPPCHRDAEDRQSFETVPADWTQQGPEAQKVQFGRVFAGFWEVRLLGTGLEQGISFLRKQAERWLQVALPQAFAGAARMVPISPAHA